MAENAVVRARIDEKTKKKATLALRSVGLTPSSAFRIMMKRIAKEKDGAFDLLLPNTETTDAMRAGLRGEVTTVNSVEELFRTLNAAD